MPDKGNGDDGDDEREDQKAFVKEMRGEMVGLDCDFSANIEVKVCRCVCRRQPMVQRGIVVLFIRLLECLLAFQEGWLCVSVSPRG